MDRLNMNISKNKKEKKNSHIMFIIHWFTGLTISAESTKILCIEIQKDEINYPSSAMVKFFFYS